MQTLTKQLIDHGFTNRVLTDKQLGRVVEGSKQSRYNLVGRAVREGELVRIRKGVYILDQKFREYGCHPYSLAQALVPGSYISLETALAYHGWIPEAVYETASILPGRKAKEYENELLGKFSFRPLAAKKGYFLELVERVQINKQTMLIAKPVRALMDLVCLRKMEWKGVDWLEKGMRIDYEYLRSVNGGELRTLKLVYKQKRVLRFLEELERELGLELGG
jgi:predicted transcriptional regulator of viral defense system